MRIFTFIKSMFLKLEPKVKIPSKLFSTFDKNIVCPYDTKKLVWAFSGKCNDIYNGDFYFISSEYHNLLCDILVSINLLLKESHNEHKDIIPLFNYRKTDLRLSPTTESVFDCCMFFYHPIGYKEKESKEPYSISLRFGDKLHDYFKVFYNKKGEIVRIECICYFNGAYRICFTMQKGVLDLYCVYRTSNSKTSLLYGVWQNKTSQK